MELTSKQFTEILLLFFDDKMDEVSKYLIEKYSQQEKETLKEIANKHNYDDIIKFVSDLIFSGEIEVGIELLTKSEKELFKEFLKFIN